MKRLRIHTKAQKKKREEMELNWNEKSEQNDMKVNENTMQCMYQLPLHFDFRAERRPLLMSIL